MKVFIILILTALTFWLPTTQAGIAAFATGGLVVYLIKNDKAGQSIEDFYALGFAIIVVGGLVALIS